MKGNEIINRISVELADSSHERWSREDLASFVTWSQHWIVSMRPDAYATHETVSLAAGAQQSLTSLVTDGWRVVQGVRNVDGRILRTLSKSELDRMLPNDWPEMPAAKAYYLAVDRVDHDRFWVWPPAASNDEIELLVAKNPGDVTTENEDSDLALGDFLREPLVDYALSIALRRDTASASREYAGQLQVRAAQMLARVLPMPGDGQQAQAQPEQGGQA